MRANPLLPSPGSVSPAWDRAQEIHPWLKPNQDEERLAKEKADWIRQLTKLQEVEVTKPTGLKYDGDKPRMDLLDPEFLEDVSKVLTFGAKKYAAHNWRGGISYSRLIGAIYRHLGAVAKGEDIDPESGLPHTAHLGCCVMFLNWMMANKPELDDRWTNSTTEAK